MEHDAFLPLLLITGLAVTVPVVLNRFRRVQLPIVVGEIIAGIIIGRSGFNIVQPQPTLDFLAEFGFAYLMFLSGLEVDFSILTTVSAKGSKEPWWRKPVPLGVAFFAGTIVLAFLASIGLSSAGWVESPFLMALILSTTSLGIVAPVLKERRLMGNDYGQSLLIAASLADFATLLLLTVVIAVRGRGFTLDLLLIPALLLIFIMVARAARVFSRFRRLRRVLNELSHATAQIQVRGAFALMVAWVVLAEAFGVEVILGAFLAGAIIGLVSGHEESDARTKLDAIGFGFFIPIFFITVGANFDLSALVQSEQALLLVPILIAIAYLVKVIPALIYRTRFSWSETIAGGFLLSSRLSLIIAAAAIALEIGAISQALQSGIVLVAIVTCTLSPIVFNRIYRGGEEEKRRGIIVVGKDQITELLVSRLSATERDLAVISADQSLIDQVKRRGVDTYVGAPSDLEIMRQAGAATKAALVILENDDESTLQACQIAKAEFNIPLLVARVTDVEYLPDLRELGVRVVQPSLATMMALEGALRFPSTFDLLTDHTDDAEVLELVLNHSAYINQPLKQIRLPGNALILSIRRDSEIIVPHGDTTLQAGDRVALIGNQQSVEAALMLLEG